MIDFRELIVSWFDISLSCFRGDTQDIVVASVEPTRCTQWTHHSTNQRGSSAEHLQNPNNYKIIITVNITKNLYLRIHRIFRLKSFLDVNIFTYSGLHWVEVTKTFCKYHRKDSSFLFTYTQLFSLKIHLKTGELRTFTKIFFFTFFFIIYCVGHGLFVVLPFHVVHLARRVKWLPICHSKICHHRT